MQIYNHFNITIINELQICLLRDNLLWYFTHLQFFKAHETRKHLYSVFNGPEISRFDTHRRLNDVIKEIQKIIRSEKEDKRNDNEKEEKIACVAE